MTTPDKELVARALYEDWVGEDFAHEYVSWELLPDKETWQRRAHVAFEASGIKTLQRDNEALNAYRAAVSYIGADSWDGCSDCIEILRAARTIDVQWDWAGDPNRIAAELKRVRRAAALSKGEGVSPNIKSPHQMTDESGNG